MLEAKRKVSKSEILIPNALWWIYRKCLDKKIAGESEEQFIYAVMTMTLLFNPSHKVVMQNPDHYIDVRKDWSIEKIQLYFIGGDDPPEQDKSANIPRRILSTTSEADCLSDIKKLMNDTVDPEALNIPEGYRRTVNNKYGSCCSYYIRVHFNESENIILDLEVELFYSPQDNARIIYVDVGKEPSDIATPAYKSINIMAYTSLADWIQESVSKVRPNW